MSNDQESRAAAPAPRVSVCIPVFNRRNLIVDCVTSALMQNVDNMEIIIVDNHSDDGTWEYICSLTDPRIRVYRNDENIGLFGNFNRCGNLATGDYVVFLCSDDRLTDGFLASALDDLADTRGIVLYSTCGALYKRKVDAGHFLKKTGQGFPCGCFRGTSVIPAFFWAWSAFGINPFNYPSGVLLERKALQKSLPFHDNIGNPADVDLFLRILQLGNLMVTDRIGCHILVHDQQEGYLDVKAGHFIAEQQTLIRCYKEILDRYGIYKICSVRTGGCALKWLVCEVLHGNVGLLLQKRHFGMRRRDILCGGIYRLYSRLYKKVFSESWFHQERFLERIKEN